MTAGFSASGNPIARLYHQSYLSAFSEFLVIVVYVSLPCLTI